MKVFDFRFLTICFILLLSLPSGLAGSKGITPELKYPSRHLIFQPGGVGEKPWHYNASYVPKANFNSAVFTQLLYFNNSYDILPGLFKDYNWDESSNSYIFRIDTSFKFDNKRALKPEDIEFALIKSFLTKDLKQRDRFRGFFDNIYGLEKVKPGMKFVSGMCSGIEVLKNNKIKIRLKRKNVFFLYFLGELIPPVAPVEDFQKDFFTFTKLPRGTGEYRVAWSDPASSLVRLERKEVSSQILKNTSYPLSIDFYIHGKALDNKADLTAGSGSDGTRKNKDYKSVTGSTPVAINVMDFNFGNNLGKNKLFRKAISLATDRKKMLATYSSGKPAHEMIPSVYYGRSRTKYKYDPVESARIVKKYFSKISSPKSPLRVWFHGYKKQKVKRYAKSLADQYKKIGIHVKFEPAEVVSFDSANKDVVFGIYGMVTSFVDPISPFTTYLTDEEMEFHADQKDKRAANLYKKAQNTNDKIERSKRIAKLSKYFQDQFMQIPLKEIYPGFTYTSRVKNVGMVEMSYKIDFSKVTLSK